MGTLLSKANLFFNLIFSITFFTIVIHSLYSTNKGKRNLSWTMCALSFFLFFVCQFLNSVSPSAALAEKILVLTGYNIIALVFLYPLCLTMSLYGTIRKNRISLAGIAMLCFSVAVLHFFRLVMSEPSLRPPLGYYATPGPYFWLLLSSMGIAFAYSFAITFRALRMPDADIRRRSHCLWIFLATFFLMVATIIQALTIYDIKIPRESILVWIFFAIVIGYSVFRQGVFGFGGIPALTISSLIVGTIFVAVHHTIIVLVEKWVIVTLSLPESEYISIGTAFALVIFVQPLYVFIHHKIDAAFQVGEKPLGADPRQDTH